MVIIYQSNYQLSISNSVFLLQTVSNQFLFLVFVYTVLVFYMLFIAAKVVISALLTHSKNFSIVNELLSTFSRLLGGKFVFSNLLELLYAFGVFLSKLVCRKCCHDILEESSLSKHYLLSSVDSMVSSYRSCS